ncbi:MAG TPA: hypothetical protein VGL72_01360, partial [Bryobacteraceae bacterium]
FDDYRRVSGWPELDKLLQGNNCGSSIPAGGKCTITVTFDPTKKGSLTADLDVYDSGGGTYQRVTLSGTGD